MIFTRSMIAPLIALATFVTGTAAQVKDPPFTPGFRIDYDLRSFPDRVTCPVNSGSTFAPLNRDQIVQIIKDNINNKDSLVYKNLKFVTVFKHYDAQDYTVNFGIEWKDSVVGGQNVRTLSYFGKANIKNPGANPNQPYIGCSA